MKENIILLQDSSNYLKMMKKKKKKRKYGTLAQGFLFYESFKQKLSCYIVVVVVFALE